MPDGAGCEQSGAVSGYYGRCDLSFAYAAGDDFQEKKIENRFVRSFLAYVPYAVLAAMTIPDIFFATASLVSAALGLAAAILLSYKGKSLLTVALGAVAVIFLAQRLLPALKRWGIKTESVSIAADSPALSFVFFTEKPTGSALFFAD